MKDYRDRLPKVYVGNRRVGKSHQLIKQFNATMNAGGDAFIVAMSLGMRDYIRNTVDIKYRDRVIYQLNQAKKIKMRNHGLIVWYVDEWVMVNKDLRRALTSYAWQGDKVIGFTSPFPETEIFLEFDKNFETNPNLTQKEINEVLTMLLGE